MFSIIFRVTLKDIKAFLPRVNCKIATNKLREVFQEVDLKNRGEIGFDDFVLLYHKLMFDINVSKIKNCLFKLIPSTYLIEWFCFVFFVSSHYL